MTTLSWLIIIILSVITVVYIAALPFLPDRPLYSLGLYLARRLAPPGGPPIQVRINAKYIKPWDKYPAGMGPVQIIGPQGLCNVEFVGEGKRWDLEGLERSFPDQLIMNPGPLMRTNKMLIGASHGFPEIMLLGKDQAFLNNVSAIEMRYFKEQGALAIVIRDNLAPFKLPPESIQEAANRFSQAWKSFGPYKQSFINAFPQK